MPSTTRRTTRPRRWRSTRSASGRWRRRRRGIDATLVHYGTDFVFDGTASEPYREDDAPNPQSVYAASKLLGDWFAQGARAYVLRVESLFGGEAPAPGAGGRRLGGSLRPHRRRAARGARGPSVRRPGRVPSHVEDVATATVALLPAAPVHGLYHCVGSGHATWLDVAAALAGELGVEPVIRGITLTS